jgi:hypothetical protein
VRLESQQEVQQTTITSMMSSQVNGGGGIIKKLLLPCYTDAGRNDTYLPTSSSSLAKVVEKGANNNQHYKASSVVSSEASTEIRDNRSALLLLSTPPSKQQQLPRSHHQHHQQPEFLLARSISTTAVVSDFPLFDDETAARNPYDDDDEAIGTPRISRIMREQQQEDDDDDEHTMNENGNGSSSPGTTASYGEEEATPAQTAFGKQLLFQRKIIDPKTRLEEQDDDDDVLSTASESGTVVDLAQRLNDVEKMIGSFDDDNKKDDNTTTTTTARHSPYHDNHHHHHDPKLVLAMPTLDDEPELLPTAAAAATAAASSYRPSNLNQLLRSPKRNGGATDYTTGPATTTILSSAVRRFVASPRSSSNTTTSSSFLLRSPGSAAYEEAAMEQQQQQKQQRQIITRTSPLQRRRINTKVLPMRSCFSFDVAGADESSTTSTSAPFFHRTIPTEGTTNRTTTTTTIDRSASWDVGKQLHRTANTMFQHRPHAFTTPTRSSTARNTGPIQRIEMEREDAIDILSCLVERGISWKPMCPPNAPDSSNATEDEQKDHDDDDDDNTNSIVVQDLVQNLNVPDDRMACLLKELVKSHEYALEMKRASKSASVWLQSIGRHSPSKAAHAANAANNNNKTSRVLMDDTTTISTNLHSAIHVATTDLTDENDLTAITAAAAPAASSPVDLVTAKALLRRAQREIQDRTEQYDRLNDELAQCRAEIGRLNTLNSQFRSNVNRSILDENDDYETNEEEEEAEDGLQQDRNQVLLGETAAAVDLDSSFMRESSSVVPRPNIIENFRAALEQANAIIVKLHAATGTDDEPAPVVSIPKVVEEKEEEVPAILEKNNSPSNKDEQMINVRMLDAENFETDWDEMVPPLPAAPPEHELRSPIVAAVLQAWTSDRGLHESLLKWMEEILASDDDDNDDAIPPLTLSGLDHQVRDGFCLHILPLLLRKPDIHVQVQTRLQRRTTYDLAVTVESTTTSSTTLNDSAATTTVMSNNRIEPSTRLSYDEFAERDIKSPDDDDDDEREMTGSWTSISGALWGSLTTTTSSTARRKAVAAANADVEEPYHRVVSAPAGRIGVTFVEYRGHCMVSDVAIDSPLLNWVYPSDVLIAIDELPVSGTRVRDIIKVLKDRSDRPRALRVVSSHSMSTLTAAH